MSYESLVTMFNKKVADLVLFQGEDKSKTWKERKQHTIDELSGLEDEDTKIVCFADKLANMRAISRDYDALGDGFWERFNISDKDTQGWYYKGLRDSLGLLAKYQEYQEFAALVGRVFG